jgi:hypothetical protein
MFYPGVLERLGEFFADEFATVVRAECLDFALRVILPPVLYDEPGLWGLIFGSEQLHIQEIGVVVQEHDNVQFAVGSDGGQSSA